MKEILLFAGTTEGRKLSECLAASGIAHTICVATEYGKIVLKENDLVKIHEGRMDAEEMRAFITGGNFSFVVDATHPYATVVTQNIVKALENADVTYLRLKREEDDANCYDNIRYFENSIECAEALKATEGNILLTTGSKELDIYCGAEEVRNRLYVRVLPGMESLKLCMDQGISGKQIIAMQGPFTEEMNLAMLHQYQIEYLVTKESGTTGGYREKLAAAKEAGIPVYVIGRAKEQGEDFEVVCSALEKLTGKEIIRTSGFDIVLAGIGMGQKSGMTKDVQRAIEEADILIGAKRMISEYQGKADKKAFYKAEQILTYLKELQSSGRAHGKIAILFSGDSGFYSGCKKVFDALNAEIEEGTLAAKVTVLPGISSVAYLASCIGESYQDAAIYSMHGKELYNITAKIKHEKKSFILMNGVKDVRKLGAVLESAGLEGCTVIAGYRLSYPEQKILKLSVKECAELSEEGLYTCCVLNPKAESKRATHGCADSEFLRDKVPMTKEEIREVSICKLKLHKDSVVYDVGSGTGSIAVEIAKLLEDSKVYAIEKKEEAGSLIQQNKEKFMLDNIEIISANAPDGLKNLPVATHAFIGGSGGNLKEILAVLYEKNPSMRVVINAISMETICDLREVLELEYIKNTDVVQLQVSRSKQVGAYHLMQAENPVWICSFDFFVPEE